VKSLNLTKVQIVNFQSIRDATIELGRYTALVGDSDQGKTAAMRAIAAVFTNPPIKEHLHKGAKKCAVVLEFNDGTRVAFAKGESASYRIAVGGKIFKYDRIGKDIPPEITALAKRWKGGGDPVLIQMQGQKEGDFLLAERGVKAQRGIDAIDAKVYRLAAQKCDTSIRKAKLERTGTEKDLDSVRARAAQLAEIGGLVQLRTDVRARAAANVELLRATWTEVSLREERTKWTLKVWATEGIPEVPRLLDKPQMLLYASVLGGVEPAVPGLGKAVGLLKMAALAHIGTIGESQGAFRRATLYLETAYAVTGAAVCSADIEKVEKALKVVEEKLFESGFCPICGKSTAACDKCGVGVGQ